MLGPDLLNGGRACRASTIADRYFDYPLRPSTRSTKPGVIDSARRPRQLPVGEGRPDAARGQLRGLGLEPLRSAALPIFFKTYTEKVWGIPCDTISAEWAAQRIKGLSLRTAILNMLACDRAPRRDADQDAHRRVRIPAPGSGNDVGGLPRRDSERAAAPSCWMRASSGLVHDGHGKVTEVNLERDGLHDARSTHPSSPPCRCASS